MIHIIYDLYKDIIPINNPYITYIRISYHM